MVGSVASLRVLGLRVPVPVSQVLMLDYAACKGKVVLRQRIFQGFDHNFTESFFYQTPSLAPSVGN